MTDDEIAALAGQVFVTARERELQRVSFAYGNVKLASPAVTRDMVERAADELDGIVRSETD